MRPVTQYCSHKETILANTNKRVLSVFLLVWVLCSLFAMIQSFPNMREGIFRILTDAAAGQDIYDDTMADASDIGNGTSIGNLPIVFSNVFADVGTLFCFYYIVKYKPNKFYAILMMVAMIAPFFQAISVSQRGPALDRLYSIAITYMLLRPYYSEKVKKIARLGAILIGAFLVVAMFAITMSRFGRESEEKAGESVYAYVGMENLNFNLYAFDNNGLRYGDRTAPIFKRMLGFRNVPTNFMQRRAKYPHLKIDDGLFIGFVGDFCLDYGPFLSVLLFLLFSALFCMKTIPRKKTIQLHQLVLIQFAACVCMCGGMKLFSFADLGNLKIIAVLLTYWLFKYCPKGKKKSISRYQQNKLVPQE